MSITRVPIILVLVFLAGCATLPPDLRSLDESDGIGNTTILRNYNYFGSAVHYWPTVEGQEIAGIFRRQYVSFNLPSGDHQIGVKCCLGSFFSYPWSQADIHVTVVEGVRRYFLLSPRFPKSDAKIEEISEDEAMTRMSEATRIRTGFLSDCDGNPVSATKAAPWHCFNMALP